MTFIERIICEPKQKMDHIKEASHRNVLILICFKQHIIRVKGLWYVLGTE